MADPAGSLRSGARACVSIAGADPGALATALEAIREADLVELRWDRLAVPAGSAELRRLVDMSAAPILFTCRPAWQGGGYDGPEAERAALLETAFEVGARWVDVEMDSEFAVDLVRAHPERALVSHHWERARPTDLDARVEALLGLEPAIGKLVAPAERPTDAIPFLGAAERLRAAGIFPAVFCMGEAGRASRLLSAAVSGGVLYVTQPEMAATAAGQWSLPTVRQELRIGRWNPGQQIFGLIGDPIDHSLSPCVFNAAFAAAGRPACYVPLPSPELGEALAMAEAAGLAGLSVTMPFKEEAAARSVRLEGLAGRIGAANTLVRARDGWVGHNTDGPAVVESLAAHLELPESRVVIVGAGGAARAAAAALVGAGADVVVVNRTAARARALARELGCAAAPLASVPELELDAIVNATPVGMDSTARTPVSTAGLEGREVVLEMIYRPAETELLRQARERGCTLVPGVEMFVRQAEMQHRIWTGEPPPLGSLRKAAAERLEADRFA